MAEGSGRLQTGPTGRGPRGPAELHPPPDAAELDTIYARLLEAYGEQQWWPAASEDGEAARFEICAGAILTQNTAWRGAAAALERLRAADALSPEAISALPDDPLGELIRPSGYYRLKARRLKSFAETVLVDYGGSVDGLLTGDPQEVRGRLLAIWGIGPETADAITLYAARLPTFVVDAYAYRLFERLGRPLGERRYDVYREHLLGAIGPDVWRLNEWHALIVRHGQRICLRNNPRCEECVLLGRCAFGQDRIGLRSDGARGVAR